MVKKKNEDLPKDFFIALKEANTESELAIFVDIIMSRRRISYSAACKIIKSVKCRV